MAFYRENSYTFDVNHLKKSIRTQNLCNIKRITESSRSGYPFNSGQFQ